MDKENVHSQFMLQAIDMAKSAQTPFGAVLVHGTDIYKAANTGSVDGKIHHAEINVLLDALPLEKKYKLILYTTCEPCPMCMGAAIWSEVDEIYYGANIEFATRHLKQILLKANEIQRRSFRRLKLVGGVEESACEQLILEFAS